tara:strand:+ start:946 stop:1431 length:486 start_codon:yes stop_codon:yes gene_type:complete
MSSQYLNQSIPNENVNMRVNNAVIDGSLSSNNLSVSYFVSSDSLILNGTGKITLPALPTYTQIGTETSPLTITGAEEQFIIKTSSTGVINPSTTRLFNVNHTGIISQKTMVLLSRTSSIGGSPQLLNWVAYTDNGLIRIARHNLSTIPETGYEEIIVKLIQ